MNLTTIPLQDGFQTTLTQEWDWQVGAMFVAEAPDFTFPAWETTYIVVNPTTTPQLAEIDSYDAVNNTLNVSNVTNLELGNGVVSTSRTHPVQSTVIISDNFNFWKDIKEAINSKISDDWTGLADGFDLSTPTSGVRIRDDAWNLRFTDNFNAEIDLTTIAAAAWADRKVAISAADATPDELDAKLLAWAWLSKTTNNPWGNENLQFDTDLTDATVFTTTQWNADKALKTDWSWNIDSSFQSTESVAGIVIKASDAEVVTGTENTKYVTAKQLHDNYSSATWHISNESQTLAWSGNLTFTIPANTEVILISPTNRQYAWMYTLTITGLTTCSIPSFLWSGNDVTATIVGSTVVIWGNSTSTTRSFTLSYYRNL